jgi:hypothetical protein
LDGLIPIELDGKLKPRVVHWSGKLPDFAKHLRTWGEAGTVKTKTPTTATLADRGVHCMFVRYALDHAGAVYRMWNPKTGWVHETCDVIWLRRMYFEKPVEQEEIGIMPTLDENKMVQAGESKAAQMTETLSESESDDDHSEAGEIEEWYEGTCGGGAQKCWWRRRRKKRRRRGGDRNDTIRPSHNQTDTFD